MASVNQNLYYTFDLDVVNVETNSTKGTGYPNTPAIARASDGTLHYVGLYGSTYPYYYYSTTNGTSWNTRQQVHNVSTASNAYPSICLTSNNTVHIFWWNSAHTQLNYAYGNGKGASWTISTDIGSSFSTDSYFTVTVDFDDTIHVFYEQGSDLYHLYGSGSGSSWTEETLSVTYADPSFPNAYVDGDGVVNVCYYDYNSTNSRGEIHYGSFENGSWAVHGPVFGTTDMSKNVIWAPQIVIGTDDVVHIVGRASTGLLYSHAAKYTAGSSFTNEGVIVSGNTSIPSLIVASGIEDSDTIYLFYTVADDILLATGEASQGTFSSLLFYPGTIVRMCSRCARTPVGDNELPGLDLVLKNNSFQTYFTRFGIDDVFLKTPHGGESWDQSTSHDITWTNDISGDHIHLKYSDDGGASYSNDIVASTADDGTYAWSSLPVADTDYRVQIIVEDGANATLASYEGGTFSIVSSNVSQDAYYTYTLVGNTTQSLYYTYTLASGISNDLYYTYDILISSISNDLYYTYTLAVDITNDLYYTYTLVGNTTQSLYYTYTLAVDISNDLYYTYTLASGISNDLYYTYTLASGISNDLYYTYDIVVGIDLYYTYTLIGNVAQNLYYTYDTESIVTSFARESVDPLLQQFSELRASNYSWASSSASYDDRFVTAFTHEGSLYVKTLQRGDIAWSSAQLVAENAASPYLSVDSDGVFYLVWEHSNGVDNAEVYYTYSSFGLYWATATSLVEGGSPAIVAYGGTSYVFYATYDNISMITQSSPWSAPVILFPSVSAATQIACASGMNNYLYLAWITDRVGYVSYSSDAGATWATPLNLGQMDWIDIRELPTEHLLIVYEVGLRLWGAISRDKGATFDDPWTIIEPALASMPSILVDDQAINSDVYVLSSNVTSGFTLSRDLLQLFTYSSEVINISSLRNIFLAADADLLPIVDWIFWGPESTAKYDIRTGNSDLPYTGVWSDWIEVQNNVSFNNVSDLKREDT